MKKVTNAYKQSVKNNYRSEYTEIVIVDKNTSLLNFSIYGTDQIFSNLENMITLGTSQYKKILTCEPNYIKLDKDYYIVKSYSSKENYFVSNIISNENGLFEKNSWGDSNCYIAIYFEKDYDLSESSLQLELEFAEVCDSFKITFNSDNVTNKDIEYLYENNKVNNIKIVIEKQYKYYPISSIRIDFFKTIEPNRLIKIKKMKINNNEYIAKNNILDYNIIEQDNIIDNFNYIKNEIQFSVLNDKYDLLDFDNYVLNNKNKVCYVFYNLKVGNNYIQNLNGYYDITDIKFENNKIKYVGEQKINISEDNSLYQQNQIFENTSAYDIIKDITQLSDSSLSSILTNRTHFQNVLLSGFIPKVPKLTALNYVMQASKGYLTKNKDFNSSKIYYKINSFMNSSNVEKIERKFINLETFDITNKQNFEINVYEYLTNFTSQEKEKILQKTFTFAWTDLTHDYEEELYYIDITIDYSNPFYPKSIEVIIDEFKDQDGKSAKPDVTILSTTNYSCSIRLSKGWFGTSNETYTAIISVKGVKLTSSIKETKKYGNFEDASVIKIDNPLITQSYNKDFNIDEIGNYFLNLTKTKKINLNTLKLPYLEIGDNILYTSKNNHQAKIVITKMETNQSIIQDIEGVVIDE